MTEEQLKQKQKEAKASLELITYLVDWQKRNRLSFKQALKITLYMVDGLVKIGKYK